MMNGNGDYSKTTKGRNSGTLWVLMLLGAILAGSLFLLVSCTSEDAALVGEEITKSLVGKGMSQVQAEIVGQVVGEQIAAKLPSGPPWLQYAVDLVILTLFPALAMRRNSTRATQLVTLKDEILKVVLPQRSTSSSPIT